MNFGAHHYMPVLKAKRGEKAALGLVAAPLWGRVTPLLEIVERTDKSLDAHLKTAFTGLGDGVRQYPRCFLDAREIASDGPSGATQVFELAAQSGIVFAPVTGISRTADLDAALDHQKHGIALRLTRSEFEKGGLAAGVPDFLNRTGLEPEGVDLIVDLGPVDALVSVGIRALTTAFLTQVPHHDRWRTLTVSACSFPRSMGGVGRHSHDFVERADSVAWRDGCHAQRTVLPRLPTFGDGCIQHPTGVEGFDPRIHQVSASIRYTTSSDSWLLIKGESTRITPARVQFRDLATRLVYGRFQTHYRGAGHCHGCESMKAAADGVPRLGSAEVWRRLGTIHHITTVVEELAALSWP